MKNALILAFIALVVYLLFFRKTEAAEVKMPVSLPPVKAEPKYNGPFVTPPAPVRPVPHLIIPNSISNGSIPALGV